MVQTTENNYYVCAASTLDGCTYYFQKENAVCPACFVTDKNQYATFSSPKDIINHIHSIYSAYAQLGDSRFSPMMVVRETIVTTETCMPIHAFLSNPDSP